MYFLYDFLQFLLLILVLPKILWERVFNGRFKGRFACLLGIALPKVKQKKGKVYLMYAVSMGETKAAASLFRRMKSACPGDQFYIVSRTETGHEEAKKSLQDADGYFLLPIDFSWGMKRFLEKIQPDVVIVVENDFWMNFLRISKCLGALVFLVSGKISLRSFQRFRKTSFFSKRLFSFFDLICAQNALFKERFVRLGADSANVCVTGNLKCDAAFTRIDDRDLKQKLGIQKQDHVLVLASTHSQEEEALLKALDPLWEQVAHLKLIVVPRHPERFLEVEEMIQKKGLSVITYSNIRKRTGYERVVLIDAMGMLLSVYQVADLAIVGGSFLEVLQGHNIFEPVQVGIPVLFGPYMSDQKGLVECILSAEAGRQTSLEEVALDVEDLLQNHLLYQKMQKQGAKLLLQMEGSSTRTWEALCRKQKETVEV